MGLMARVTNCQASLRDAIMMDPYRGQKRGPWVETRTVG
jgi:hypothetical protein